ncbi:CcmD family protein [Terrimonas rubra]|uniref:CcmD family protein n=1 Tax=Terrimonas rubra TaxID=1035890 RepID=A0ABW6A919_9BACT
MKLKLIALLAVLLSGITMINAQNTVPQETLMRSSGRIYVVVAVMLTILAGIIIYLVRLDRKIGKLEKHS